MLPIKNPGHQNEPWDGNVVLWQLLNLCHPKLVSGLLCTTTGTNRISWMLYLMLSGFPPMPAAQTVSPGRAPLPSQPMLGKPALTPQATWNSFAELCLGTGLSPRRMNRQYCEHFVQLFMESKYSYSTMHQILAWFSNRLGRKGSSLDEEQPKGKKK